MSLRTSLLTMLALGTTAAFAHAELVSSTPENGETVSTAPAQIELVFSESAEASVSTFKVYPLPDDLAAAEAATAQDEAMEPLDDTSDDDAGDDTAGDDATSDDTSSDDDSTSSDDQDDASSDDSLDSSRGVAAFVSSVINTEGDEAERVDTDVSAQGAEISIDIASDLAPGWYVAMWSALSDDGHPVEGYVTFNYEP